MNKKIEIFKNANGWNIEVYENGKLIDWRCGLTKSGLNKYKSCYDANGYLSEGTKHIYTQIN